MPGRFAGWRLLFGVRCVLFVCGVGVCCLWLLVVIVMCIVIGIVIEVGFVSVFGVVGFCCRFMFYVFGYLSSVGVVV